MKPLFRSRMSQLFASRFRTAWMASVVIAALAILLTSTATYASTASTPSSVRTTLTTSAASMPVAIRKLPTAPNTDHVPCPADSICLYPGTNYTFQPQIFSLGFPGGNMYENLDTPATLSYINNGDYRGWLNQSTTNPHGTSYCMSPNSRNADITGPWDTDQWLLLSTNPDNC